MYVYMYGNNTYMPYLYFYHYRHHLQALRHMYVLAAECRVLVTVDNDTGKACSVPICVTTNHGELTAMSPCIVPSWEDIIEVMITYSLCLCKLKSLIVTIIKYCS